MTNDEETPRDRLTRSERRRFGEDSAKLAHELMELTDAAVARLELPETLREELLEARRIHSPGARRRQERRLAQVLREHEIDEVRESIDGAREVDRKDARRFRQVESWRDRLVAEGDSALAELLQVLGEGSRGELTELVERARHEREWGKPRGAGRALFRRLGELLKEA